MTEKLDPAPFIDAIDTIKGRAPSQVTTERLRRNGLAVVRREELEALEDVALAAIGKFAADHMTCEQCDCGTKEAPCTCVVSAAAQAGADEALVNVMRWPEYERHVGLMFMPVQGWGEA